ncbi:GNAT family N-acetyltransferase [Agrobacterium sp. NPDC090273]|uniref:GNAT family N-acetyltransferase n=1 Tax=Agrobacterium sp. NPDC090273 TaxID=3363919 RepID=UPI00383A5C28
MNVQTQTSKSDVGRSCEAGAGHRTSGVRPMHKDDVDAVEKLINSAFGKTQRNATFDFRSYIRNVFFGSPIYDPAHGSIVYDIGDQQITSVVLALPMRFVVHRERIVGRLLCAFASDAEKGAAGAARLSRSMRPSQQDLCFTDTSSPVSADHCLAIGGIILPVESLQWHKALRPLSSMALRLGRRVRLAGSRPVLAALGFADRLLRGWKRGIRPKGVEGLTVRPADFETFRLHALPMIERFSVRPEWSSEEFHWLVEMAKTNESMGKLNCRTVEDRDGKAIGAVLYFGHPGRTAYVLNIVTAASRENDVLSQLFRHLDDENYAHVTGMSQSFLMNALYRHNQMTFRHRGYFCVTTRDEALKDSALRGDIYVGGLASESWSRLITDF